MFYKLNSVFKFIVIIIFLSGFIYAQDAPKLQAIHNIADPEMTLADVRITLLGVEVVRIDSVPFRSALPMVNALGGLPLVVEILKTNGPVVLNYPITLENGKIYAGVVRGVIDPQKFAPNPDGRDISLDVSLTDAARDKSTNPGEVQFILIHGVTDAPTIDIQIGSQTILIDNLSYGEISNYISLAPGTYNFDMTNASGDSLLATFHVDLSSYADSAMVMFLSGFLNPDKNQNGAELGLFGAFPNGNVIEFNKIPLTIVPKKKIVHPITGFSLYQNYPNPFNPMTTIEFELPVSDQVELSVFNVKGQKLCTLIHRNMKAGHHEIRWNAELLPGGVYFYRLTTPHFEDTKKMILLK